MSKMHDKMLQDMQLRGFSLNTQKTYLKNLQLFEKFFQKPARQLNQDDSTELPASSNLCQKSIRRIR